MQRLGILRSSLARAAGCSDRGLRDLWISRSARCTLILTGTIAYLLMGAVANVLCMFWPAAMKDRGATGFCRTDHLPNPCPRAITPPAAAALSPLRRLRARARARARTQRTRIHVAHSARTAYATSLPPPLTPPHLSDAHANPDLLANLHTHTPLQPD